MTTTLRKTVLGEAQSQAQKILDEAQSQAARVQQQAEREAEKQRQQILQEAQTRVAAVLADARAAAHVEAQKIVLQRREEFLTRVFSQAAECLTGLPERADYQTKMVALMREAARNLPGADNLVVRVDRATGDSLSTDELAALSHELGVNLQLGEPLDSRLGVLVMTEDGRRIYDNTLAARLARQKNVLRTSVYRILMGEEA
ncbi:MAG: V-type ATP synthase subunit E family protein [Chloroflexota bacterium]|nr:V-type ATP synthase subunit E family protein [Chloroflexota bacterium]